MTRSSIARAGRRAFHLLWQPSLARRLALAAVLAFGLAGLVLMLSAYGSYRQAVSSHAALLTACEHLSQSLVHATTDDQARAVVQAAETYFNASRADLMRERGRHLDPLVFELVAPDGRVLYASTELRGARLLAQAGRASEQVIRGKSYWGCRADFARGHVQLAESSLPDVTVLSWIGADLLPDLLLTFPFVLLPVWLAMHQGLRPLRRLTQQLEQRRRDDFSPIRHQLRHVELLPLIAAFDALLARLRDAMQRERAFVQDAAHELRTPMAVMAAQAHVLVRADTADARQQAGAALDHAVARASHLSQQLLALASLDEQRDSNAQAVDLVVLTEQVLAQAAATAQARQLDLGLDAPEHLPATLDVGAFQSVLHNLLDNALRYVPQGGRIEVSLQAQPGGWRLRVADDGPGIALADRDRIFERFVRGPSPSAAGTGLGLAIVRQAAARLGGAVSLGEGLRGRGAAFELRVPA